MARKLLRGRWLDGILIRMVTESDWPSRYPLLMSQNHEGQEEHEGWSSTVSRIALLDVPSRIHAPQLLTYMKLADIQTGLLISFNVTKLKDGIKRFVL